MMMEFNHTISANATGHSVVYGLAVGLPLSFLLIGIITAVVIYLFCCKSTSDLPLEPKKTTEEDFESTTNPHYSVAPAVRSQMPEENPVYENFQSGYGTGAQYVRYGTSESDTQGAQSEPEDLYLQCDPQEDPIYGNDPSFFSGAPQAHMWNDHFYGSPNHE